MAAREEDDGEQHFLVQCFLTTARAINRFRLVTRSAEASMSRELAVRRLCCGEEISALRSCRPRMGWASGLLGSLHRIAANIPEEHAI